MDHYLLHLSYTPAGWRSIVAAGQSFDDRLGPVRKLVAELGGGFASFHFFDGPRNRRDERKHVVRDKFALFGQHDLMAVLAMPDKIAAQALLIAISSQDAVQHVELAPMMPFEDAVTKAAAASRTAVEATRYAGPADSPER